MNNDVIFNVTHGGLLGILLQALHPVPTLDLRAPDFITVETESNYWTVDVELIVQDYAGINVESSQ